MIPDIQGMNWSQSLTKVLIVGKDSTKGHTKPW